VVDGRAENQRWLADVLVRHGHIVHSAATTLDAISGCRSPAADLVLSNVGTSGSGDGLTLLRMLKDQRPQVPVILYDGLARVEEAVRAMRMGASNYLEFPVDAERLLTAVTEAVHVRAPSAVASVGDGQPRRWPHDIVAVSPAMRDVLDFVERIGPSGLTTLLQGETGTGKELVARALHAKGERRTRPFVAINCAAIPESLFEAELFGYRKGAFTGALAEKPGLVEEASGGTLFLDEIGELPLPLQARLLRFLEDGEVRRLGANRPVHVDVRVIAATNQMLHQELAHGRFRSDLFFRLNAACCRIPALRSRLDDLDALVEFWLHRLAERLGSAARSVTPGALALLRAHPWRGNIRELRNVLEHAVCLAPGDCLTEQDLSGPLGLAAPTVAEQPSDDPERAELVAALDRNRWQLARTASSLGISRSTLWRKLRRHNIRSRESRS
jgi:DNA-binding NtrC family response regulator